MSRIALVLGLLAAVEPFAIDMYLPALPMVAADLGASIAGVQATLSAFFIAFGVSQLVYGPLSDRMGRRPPLLIGLGVSELSVPPARVAEIKALVRTLDSGRCRDLAQRALLGVRHANDALLQFRTFIFLLHRLDHLTYAEIGDVVGMSEKGVKKQMAKALFDLRCALGAI